ncbi:hypothetical protein [Qipengyuania pelagi]|uniref:hypothetical protein n=1 Tax=Qipengyuania pelagi TaxID=994320 RepID=UPI00192791FE
MIGAEVATVTIKRQGSKGKGRFVPAALVAAGLGLALPTAAALAVGQSATVADASISGESLDFLPFTPARLDPGLVREVASSIGVDALRFTPAARPARKDRTLTVAVRVDNATARAISVRKPLERLSEPGLGTTNSVAVDSTRYNLGIARGYQGFAQPKPVELPAGVRDLTMPDLERFSLEKTTRDKPDRFQPRVALESVQPSGPTPRVLDSRSSRSVEVGGAYRVVGNLNVTAGVRLSQERDRLTPLTDGVEDSQAVYVGTQLRF